MRFLTLDIEASHFDGFPIEIGWCDEIGRTESHLIRPAAGWTLWSDSAESIHGISRERLEAEGEPVAAVARRVADVLAHCRRHGITVYSDNPGYDNPWLAMLLRAGGLAAVEPLEDVERLQEIACWPLYDELPEVCSDAAYERVQARSAAIVKHAKDQARVLHKHRAAEDAHQQASIVAAIIQAVAEDLALA